MNGSHPRWLLISSHIFVWSLLWLFCGWVLMWAWYLSLTPIFGLPQISLREALWMVALLAVAGGIVFRLIPTLVHQFLHAETQVASPQVSPLQAQQVNQALLGLQQMLQQANTSDSAGHPPTPPPDQPTTTAPVVSPPRPNPLKLPGGPTEWEE